MGSQLMFSTTRLGDGVVSSLGLPAFLTSRTSLPPNDSADNFLCTTLKDACTNTAHVPPPSMPNMTDPCLPRLNMAHLSDLLCLSMNCNKANYIGHAVLNSLVEHVAIVLFQEPWLSKIGLARNDKKPNGLAVYGMIHQTSWSQVILVPHLAGLNSPVRVTAYVNKHVEGLHVSLCSDLACHLDLMVLEVRFRGLQFLLVNMYNDVHSSAVTHLITSSFP